VNFAKRLEMTGFFTWQNFWRVGKILFLPSEFCQTIGVALIMVFCEFTNIQRLWDNHFDAMAEDYRPTHANDAAVLQFSGGPSRVAR